MRPGDVIAERFELVRLAASGGMGEVFRARDLHTGETVALKTLRGCEEEESQAERFEREAELLRELSHPAIVRYVAHGRGEGEGERWLVMEWLEGETLAARLWRGPLELSESVTLARRVASALAALHGRGVIHRDVKPSNLILCGGDVEGVKLVDFGVARVRRARRQLTTAGAMVGTPGYMAPEQARGETEVDARADVFALGCVLFECLTGRDLFAGEDRLAVLLKAVLEDAPRVREHAPEVPEALDRLVAAMLEKAPERRPRDGAAVLDALDALDAAPPVNRDGQAPLAGDDPAPDALTGAERRVVSLVVARSLSGVDDDDATLTAGLDGPLLRRLRALAARHGGEITLLADGSVVISLASGAAATDLAAQAARCALALGELLEDTALAVVSGRAVLDGKLPVGELIDRAVALLGRRASPGVEVDEVTSGLLRGRFDLARDEGGLRLAGAGAVLGGARTLLGRPTPCVGRDEELGILERAFATCVEDRAAGAVVITAPAGVGKSRLAYELTRRLRAGGAATLWIGRGDPMSAGSAFGVLAQALRGALGVREGAPIAERRARVRGRVAERVPADEVPRVAEFLGELVGAPFPDEGSEPLRAARRDPRLMGDQMRQAFVELVLAVCAEEPLVILLEDLHHGDLPTVRFVDAALGAARGQPLFVLALARPEVGALFPRLWEAHAPRTIALEGLTQEASERLASLLLGSAADGAALARIAARAEGNAFYLEELIRATAEGHGGALPETVLAMAQARVEALAPELRRTLRAASVFGQVFSAAGIAALSGAGADDAALARSLTELVLSEVLTRTSEAGSELAFRHALLREVAYGMLTEEDRARGHRLAGAWLEATGSHDAAALAEHFERGGEGCSSRAAFWYRRAAQEALDGNDLQGVLHRADRGLRAAGGSADATDTGALHLLAAEARFWRGELVAAMASGEAALAALPPGTAPFYRAVGHVALVASRLSRVDRVLALSALLAAQPARGEAAEVRALALNQAVMGLFVAGHYDDADALLAVLAEAMAAQAITDPAVCARTSYSLARQAHVHGDLGEMLRRRRQAVAQATRADDRRMLCALRLGVGDAHLHLGAYADAEAELRLVIPEAARLGLASMGTAATLNLGLALAIQGRWEEGLTSIEEATLAFAAQGDPACEATARVYASLVLTWSGHPDRGEQETRAALALDADPPVRAYACAALALAMLARGRAREALTAAGEGHALLVSLGTVEEGESLIRLAWAEALGAAGDARAPGAVAEARDHVLRRAGAIRDPERQRSFLERVPENARTLALTGRGPGG
jgi:tetratricopeptide (TPR) repeat protein